MSEESLMRLRAALMKWKRAHMLKGLSEDTSPDPIETRRQTAETLYTSLMKRLDQKVQENQVGGGTGEEVEEILSSLGDPKTWLPSQIEEVRAALESELVEYPFTFNEELISSFKENNLPPF
jgi:hypothetical protein